MQAQWLFQLWGKCCF